MARFPGSARRAMALRRCKHPSRDIAATAARTTTSSSCVALDEDFATPTEARARWQTPQCIEHKPPGSAMNRVISKRQYQFGTVPFRTCNTLHLRDDKTEMPFTGFELLFLGTSAGSPTVHRNPTGVCLRTDKSNWMFDCAEASLRQLMQSTVRIPTTDKFFISHLHGDHIYGLPGLLCTLDNHNSAYMDARTRKRVPRPISVYGPVGLFTYVNAALMTSKTRLTNLLVTVYELVSPEMIANSSPYEKFMTKAPVHPCLRRERIRAESDGNGLIWKVFVDDTHKVTASTLKHTITSFGYVVEELEVPGKLRPELLIERGLTPGPQYRLLKQGKSITLPNGDIVHPADVTRPPTRGRKAVILGDTADSSRMFDIGQNCDVLVHEATLSDDMLMQAVQRGHSTARMAGYAARRMNAKLLALTHFSHRFRPWSAAPGATRTTQHLAHEAQITFGRKAVIPAADFLRIPIPRSTNDGDDA